MPTNSNETQLSSIAERLDALLVCMGKCERHLRTLCEEHRWFRENIAVAILEGAEEEQP